ncbi:Aste57867_8338 [Aphanomyces stellatus]|uniref:Aste57867_1093 protein n=1 Tax=Aphanomyces stellatus TaxID=120398 RepID=A0A485K7P0_9STRA|nr:hypothetical protein As57867_008306 [Aphanomyces stellatus]KAF0719372.1 hypothetical protein As57867_001092 [Aphanomyces stellatus]VFT78315.1 Aste57867_1093 [Aphanomyces stellatus]VFT85225.1 Aste57867_8338 [Aphanomyces stellatus]
MEALCKAEFVDAKEGDQPLDEILDKKLRRRVYLKNMRRIYRREAKEERAYLLNKVRELEQLLEPLHNRFLGTKLPWREVARAMDEERHHASKERNQLIAQAHSMDRLVFEMNTWVAAQMSLQGELGSHVPTWRERSLFANPQSRHLGKAWILQQMYHNTDRVFLEHGFPPKDHDFHLFDIVMAPPDDGGTHIVMGMQHDYMMPPDRLATYCETICAMLRVNHMQFPLPPSTVGERDGAVLLHQMTTCFGEHINILTTSFDSSPTSSTVVAQEILADEAVSVTSEHRRRRRSYWAEVYRLPDGRWRRRFFLQLSLRLCGQAEEQAPLEEEELVWGVDLSHVPPEFKDAQFRHQVKNVWLSIGPSTRPHKNKGGLS